MIVLNYIRFMGRLEAMDAALKFCYVATNSSECVWFYLFAQLEGFSLHNSTFDINILLFNDHSKPDGCFLMEKYNSKSKPNQNPIRISLIVTL